MNESKVKSIITEIMLVVTKYMTSEKSNWQLLYAAVCGVKKILEQSPVIHLQNVETKDVEAAENLGEQIGLLVAREADKTTRYFRN